MRWIAFRAKIMRMWKLPSLDEPGSYSSVHFGDKIEAFVVGPSITFFLKHLHEGAIYDFGLFNVLPNQCSVRSTLHGFRLRLMFNTGLATVSDIYFPDPTINNHAVDEVLRTSMDAKSLSNCIGLLSAVSKDKSYLYKGKLTRVAVLELCDEVGSFDCLLFGQYAMEFYAYLAKQRCNQCIVVLEYVEIHSYKGRAVVYSKHPVSRLLLNPNIVDVDNFRLRMLYSRFCRSKPTVAAVGSKNNFEGQLLGDCKSISVEQLHGVQPGIYRVDASIAGILPYKPYYYDECQCKGPIFPDLADFGCRVCGKSDARVARRFRIPIYIADSTSTLGVYLLDWDCRALLKKSCDLVYGPNDHIGLHDSYPGVFEALVGKLYCMKIEVTSLSHVEGVLNYFVRRLSAKPINPVNKGISSVCDPLTPNRLMFKPPFPTLSAHHPANNALHSQDSKLFFEGVPVLRSCNSCNPTELNLPTTCDIRKRPLYIGESSSANLPSKCRKLLVSIFGEEAADDDEPGDESVFLTKNLGTK
ncbi:hypothetical protein RIF29_06273 [Crotalaria pallida]|uniref:Uncharacterized protein n=1 Tax=Crotalaria pallida TaxID=3830 RepID=A0AAN9J3T2_CROPI